MSYSSVAEVHGHTNVLITELSGNYQLANSPFLFLIEAVH